jgi:probable rRNA maturation factor
MIDLMDADDLASSTAARRDAGPAPTIEIVIADARWRDAVADVETLARGAARAALGEAPTDDSGRAVGLVVMLADDARVRDLNRDWRGVDAPTNVLSFPALDLEPGRPVVAPANQPADQPIELGDIVLARETVLGEAVRDGKTPGDHVSHLVVHGVLHLLGYDHQHDDEAEAMEALERRLLARLGVADPYGEV